MASSHMKTNASLHSSMSILHTLHLSVHAGQADAQPHRSRHKSQHLTNGELPILFSSSLVIKICWKNIFIFIKIAAISFFTSKGHKRARRVLQLQEQTGPRRPAEWKGDYSDTVGGGWGAFLSPLIGDLVSDMSRKGPKSIV